MVIGSFLLSALSFLFGIIGLGTIYPAIANTIWTWFNK